MLRKVRTRLALLVAPWLEPEPPTEEWPFIPVYDHSATAASPGVVVTWRRTC